VSSGGQGSRVVVTHEKALEGHREAVRCLAPASPASFASGSLDGGVILWCSTTLAPLRTLHRPEVFVSPATHAFIFSIGDLGAHGAFLAAASGRGFILVRADIFRTLPAPTFT
jgi:hypothetical protein